MTFMRKTFLTVLGLVFIDQTYLSLTTPLLTLIFFDPSTRLFSPDTSQALRSAWFGIGVALPNVLNMVFAPWLSALSDEWGRRKVFTIEIFSAFIFCTFAGLGIYLGQIGFLLAGLMVRGAFSRSNPTALTIIGDTAPRDKKLQYMGYLQLSISLGAALGPVVGGLIASRYFFNELNFAFAFFVAAFIALINTGLSLLLMPETLRSTPTKKYLPSWQTLKQIFFQPEILQVSIILLFIQLSWSMYYQFIPPILKTLYHFSDHQLGWFISMIAIWLALATSVGIKWLDQFFNLRQILIISMILVFIGLLAAFLATANLIPFAKMWIWLSAVPIAAGDVIAYSCTTTLYSDHTEHHHQGKVMGISFIIVSLAWSLTGMTGGLLMGLNPLLPLIFAPLGILLAIFYTKRRLA